MTGLSPLLRVEDLAVERGSIVVLCGLNFDIAAGEAMVLRGPNGSGKTTLLRTIAGLQPPLAGRVLSGPEAVAYSGHADGVKAALSVAENLRFWAGVHGGASIKAAMRAFDLDGLADRPAKALSAGQKRRLGLARLLVTGRTVWALDEPTVSLDAEAVAMFASAVQDHLTAGGAALIASHVDLGLAARVLDVAPFRAGKTATPGAFDEAFL